MPDRTDDATLCYIHDPMCSWCWGFRPAFEQLCNSLPNGVGVRRLLGGLAPDDDRPMSPSMRDQLQATWRRIEKRIPGTGFNFDFWQACEPRRSTWPACRAVIAARTLQPGTEDLMVLAIQRAYYLEARNPSDRETLIVLAGTLGIDGRRFGDCLDSPTTQRQLVVEIERARAMGVNGLPSLRFEIGGTVSPITIDYLDPTPMRTSIERLLIDQSRTRQ